MSETQLLCAACRWTGVAGELENNTCPKCKGRQFLTDVPPGWVADPLGRTFRGKPLVWDDDLPEEALPSRESTP